MSADLQALADAEERRLHPCECGSGVTLRGVKYGTPACSRALRKFAAMYGNLPSHDVWTDLQQGQPA